MKLREDFKKTEHKYKGFLIKGDQYNTSGGYVLGGRYYVEGGIARNYHILKDGKFVFNPNNIIEKLQDAKEMIDDYLKRKNEKNSGLEV